MSLSFVFLLPHLVSIVYCQALNKGNTQRSFFYIFIRIISNDLTLEYKPKTNITSFAALIISSFKK